MTRKKVQVWLICGGDVLLLRTNAERGGFWQPITGSVERGETNQQAAVREVEEETGVILPSLVPLGFSFEFETAGGHLAHEEVFFQAVKTKPEVVISGEHQAYQWTSTSNAAELLKHDSNREALRLLLQKVER